jgi:hypothetical protein
MPLSGCGEYLADYFYAVSDVLMNRKSSMQLLSCGILVVGMISLGWDVANAAPSKFRVQTNAQPAQSVNNIKLLGYGLFLLRIGLKPLESARQCDLKLSKRLAEPAPIPENQGQHQSID